MNRIHQNDRKMWLIAMNTVPWQLIMCINSALQTIRAVRKKQQHLKKTYMTNDNEVYLVVMQLRTGIVKKWCTRHGKKSIPPQIVLYFPLLWLNPIPITSFLFFVFQLTWRKLLSLLTMLILRIIGIILLAHYFDKTYITQKSTCQTFLTFSDSLTCSFSRQKSRIFKTRSTRGAD